MRTRLGITAAIAAQLALVGCAGEGDGEVEQAQRANGEKAATPLGSVEPVAPSTGACSEKACVHRVRVDFAFPELADDPLGYSVVLHADGQPHACTVSLQKDRGGPLTCEPLLTGSIYPATRCASAQAEEKPRDCVLTERWILAAAFPHGAPEAVTVEISLNGSAIVSSGGAPSYAPAAPGGPECPEVCREGVLSL